MAKRVLPWLLICLLGASSAPLTAADDWVVGTLQAAPGTRVSGNLEIAVRPGSPGTYLPVTLIHGAQPGPTLAVIAGIFAFQTLPVAPVPRSVINLK